MTSGVSKAIRELEWVARCPTTPFDSPHPCPGSCLEWGGASGCHRPERSLTSGSQLIVQCHWGSNQLVGIRGYSRAVHSTCHHPSLLSKLVWNPGVQGTVWSNPSESSPQEPNPAGCGNMSPVEGSPATTHPCQPVLYLGRGLLQQVSGILQLPTSQQARSSPA